MKWLALGDGLVWVVRMKEMIRMTVFSCVTSVMEVDALH